MKINRDILMKLQRDDIPLDQLIPTQTEDQVGSIEPLARNIKEHDQTVPLIVNQTDKGYAVLCGNRRYYAMKSIECKTAFCIVFHGLTDAECRLVVLDFDPPPENQARRKD